MQINLNDMVEVILTEEGAEVANRAERELNYIMAKYYLSFDKPQQMKIYKEGDVYQEQLWKVIEVFGSSIGLCKNVPFKECNINIINQEG